MLTLFAATFLLGLAFNSTPGAVFAETLRRGSQGGFWPGLAVQLGSLVGDATWAILGLLGISLLLQAVWLRVPMGVLATLYLAWLAWGAWHAATSIAVAKDTTSAAKSGFQVGATLSLTNPQNIVYWAALGNAMGMVGIYAPTTSDYLVFFAGFMSASILWSFFCAALIARIYRNANHGWAKWTNRFCAVLFLLLAVGSGRDVALLAQAGA